MYREIELIKSVENMADAVTDVMKEKYDEPGYWEKLRHQAALAAMSAIMNNGVFAGELRRPNNNGIDDMSNTITRAAVIYADKLIKKLKED